MVILVEIKGSAIISAVESLKARSGENTYNEVISKLAPTERQFFEQVFLEMGWYNLDIFAKFLEKDILVTAQGNEEELISRSEAVFEKQLKGIYKIFIKLGSPGFILNKISSIHKSYFRGVDINIKMEDSNKASTNKN